MLPVIALVGRPNVGKSTLFNRITRTRDALVADFPGLTRDRQYGDGRLGERPYIVIDTGGLTGDIKKDRAAVRDQLAKIKEFDGITGKMTFTEDGDPIKCAVIVKISDKGEFEFFKSACP